VAGGFLFTAMQIALDPATGELIGATAAEQAERCLQNVRGVVDAAGGSLTDVVKTTVYLTDLAAFGAVNEVYARFFPADPPARGVVQVVALPRGARVAIEAVARLG
jgi:2-iminobutanoate/2-iminopropanoate deaminase